MPTEKEVSLSMISYKFAAAFARALVSYVVVFSVLRTKDKLRNDNAFLLFYVYDLRLSEVFISLLGISHKFISLLS